MQIFFRLNSSRGKNTEQTVLHTTNSIICIMAFTKKFTVQVASRFQCKNKTFPLFKKVGRNEVTMITVPISKELKFKCCSQNWKCNYDYMSTSRKRFRGLMYRRNCIYKEHNSDISCAFCLTLSITYSQTTATLAERLTLL